MGFPSNSDGKESVCNAGNPGSIPGSGRSPGESNGYPLLYSCLENSMDRPWGCKESDMTEGLTHYTKGRKGAYFKSVTLEKEDGS